VTRLTDDETLKWIDETDLQSREARAARARLVVSDSVDSEAGRLFLGGETAMNAFEEARNAYVSGLFLACVLLCQVYVEHTLGSLFRMMGRDDAADAAYARMLVAARDQALLTQAEFEIFDRLRRNRNPYAHPRGPDHSRHPVRRAISAGMPTDLQLADDAREAVSAMMVLAPRWVYR
jgi:hypothetical protein